MNNERLHFGRTTLLLAIGLCMAGLGAVSPAMADCTNNFGGAINLRVDIQDSPDCGGTNDQRQIVSKTVAITNCGNLVVTVIGRGEWSSVYDRVYVNGVECCLEREPTFNCENSDLFDRVVISGNSITLMYDTIDQGNNKNGFAQITQIGIAPLVQFDVPIKDSLYRLQADGTSKATAFLSDESGVSPPITWSIVGETYGCGIQGATITAGKTNGTLTVRATDSTGFFVDGSLDLDTCQTCEGGDCPGIGGVDVKNGSVDVKIGLGWSSQGSRAGYLQIKEEQPTDALAQPQSLKYTFSRPDVEVLRDEQSLLKQIKAPDGLAYVTVSNAFKYTVNLFSLTNVLPKTNGFYELANSPFSIVTIENPNNDTNKLRVTYSRDGSDTVYDYNWIADGWEFISGNGLRKEIKTTVWSQTNTVRTVTTTIQEGSNPPVFQKVERFQIFSHGEKLAQEIIGTGNNASTNTYSYTSNGDPQQIVRGDGSWEFYIYNSDRFPTNVFSGFLNQAVTTNKSLCRLIEYDYSAAVISGSGDNLKLSPSRPRRTIESIFGNEIRRSYFVALPNETREIVCVNPGVAWNASGSLVTTNKQFSNGPHAGETRSLSRADGTADLYEYGPVGTLTTNIVMTGHPDASGTNIDAGIKTVSVIDSTGKLLSETRIDKPSNITISDEAYAYDGYKRLLRTAYLDGTSTTNAYDCCSLSSTIERDGTVTAYTHDALKRPVATTRAGITVSNVLDAAGNVLAAVRYGTDETLMTLSLATYNDSREITSSTDALGNAITYTSYFDGAGQRIRKVTYPDLTTRQETYAREGSLLKITGTAVRGLRHDYGVQAEGGFQRPFDKEIRLDASGGDTLEWIKSFSDGAGRQYKVIFADTTPGSETDNPFNQVYFNTKGQLWKQRDADGVVTLFTNNVRNELNYTAVDVNGNDVIDFGGNDRITQTTNDVYFNATLNANLRRSRTYVWGTLGSNTSNLVSTVESSVDGLRRWEIVYRDASTAVTNSSQAVYSGDGVRYETNTAPDRSSTVTQFQFGRVISLTSMDNTGAQVGGTTFAYDAHGRRSELTDTRNGTATFTFNNGDLVTTATTPLPGTGQNAQTTLTYYNNRLQVTNTVAADGASTYFEFYPSGELKQTSGARTYPVQYGYDYAGRMSTMMNWTSFATSAGARQTTWNYDGNRGWLTNKTYAGAVTGPDYTYTAAGRLKKRTWARIGTQSKRIFATYSYGIDDGSNNNDHGDLVSVVYSQDPQSTPSTTYTYDRRGRRATAVRNSITTTFTYDNVGDMLSESHSGGTLGGLAVTNVFDTFLRRITNSAWNGAVRLAQAIYTYDAASRVQTVSDGTNSATYAYVPASPLVSQITFRSNTVVRLTTTKVHDYLDRLQSIDNSAGGAGVGSFAVQHNDANQRVRSGLPDGSFWVYEYDSMGQVKTGKRYWSDGTPVAGQQFEYAHDDIGNRTSTKVGGDENGASLRSATYSPNLLNQCTNRTVPTAVDILGIANATATVTVNGQSTYRRGEYYRKELTVTNASVSQWQGVTNRAVEGTTTNTVIGNVYVQKTPEIFSYDADGNLLSDGHWNYTWDAENRLIIAVVNTLVGPQQYLAFEYDHQGRRIGKKIWNNNTGSGSPATTLKFLYDGWNLVALLNGSALQQSFLWGLDLSGSEYGAGGVGGLLKITHVGTQTTNCFMAFDGNGNVAGLVNAANGSIAGQYEYGPFGEAIRASGPIANVNPFRFSTKYQDSETDLLYYGYRYYSASMGRWLSRDPIEEVGGLNLYGFINNDPVRHIDRAGLVIWGPVLAFAWECVKSVTEELAFDYLGKLIQDGRACELGDKKATELGFDREKQPRHEQMCKIAGGTGWKFTFEDLELPGLASQEDATKLWKKLLNCAWGKIASLGKGKISETLINAAQKNKVLTDAERKLIEKEVGELWKLGEKSLTSQITKDIKITNDGSISCSGGAKSVASVTISRTVTLTAFGTTHSKTSSPYNSGGCGYKYSTLASLCGCPCKAATK